MVLHYVYNTLWMVQLAGVVLRTGVLMGIYTPAERWKREYREIKEEPSLTYTDLKPPAAGAVGKFPDRKRLCVYGPFPPQAFGSHFPLTRLPGKLKMV